MCRIVVRSCSSPNDLIGSRRLLVAADQRNALSHFENVKYCSGWKSVDNDIFCIMGISLFPLIIENCYHSFLYKSEWTNNRKKSKENTEGLY